MSLVYHAAISHLPFEFRRRRRRQQQDRVSPSTTDALAISHCFDKINNNDNAANNEIDDINYFVWRKRGPMSSQQRRNWIRYQPTYRSRGGASAAVVVDDIHTFIECWLRRKIRRYNGIEPIHFHTLRYMGSSLPLSLTSTRIFMQQKQE